MVDAIRVNVIASLASAGIPFSGIDVLVSAGVGLMLLVAVVGAHVAIRRSRRPAHPRVVRAPQPARAETDVAASG